MASVAVPVYNNEETIRECVESLIAQDYRPVEIVVVDDGSSDGTLDRATEMARSHANVKVVRTTHSGPSHARNVGTLESSGEYLLFADADAVYSADYLSKGIRVMESNPEIGGVCVTGTIWLRKSTFVSRGIALEYEMKQKYLRAGKRGPYFAFLYRRAAIEKVGGFDEQLFQGEDKDLFTRVKRSGYKIGLVEGFNWQHLYPQDVSTLVRRGYRGGKQRVVYLVKNRMYLELLRKTAGMWALVAVALFSAFYLRFLPIVIVLMVGFYAYRALAAAYNLGGKGKAIDVFLLPLVSAIRYLSTALGYTKGSIAYFVRRMLGLKTSWSQT